MNNREIIYRLIRLSVDDAAEGFDAFVGVSSVQWDWVFNTLSMHGLSAFAYSAIERLPQDARPPKDILLKFISANMTGQQSYLKIKQLAGKIDEALRQADIKCLLLKGLSLAEYYKNPQSRKFLDIDLYAPGAELRVDQVFVDKGVHVDTEFYRHSHMTLNGILVENHHCLLDVQGRQRQAELDADLKTMALKHLESCEGPGLYYPDSRFSLIFNLHHAMSHFIYEGISFKFLVDWICFLRTERNLLSTDQTAESLREHGLLKFSAVMSKVCVDHLGLDIRDVPECIQKEMMLLQPKLVQRFIDDLFRPYEKVHQGNIVSERIHSVLRIIKAAWKPKAFLGQSAIGFVWDKFLPILRGKKFEAD